MRKILLTLTATIFATLFAQAATTTEVCDTPAQERATEVPTQKLGVVVYKRVDVKGKRRWRYVCGDVVMTSREFEEYCRAYCPQAHRHVRKAFIYSCVSLATCWTLTINWGFLIASYVQSAKALPVYNEYCAEK